MVASPVLATETPERVVLFEAEYADAFVGNEQGYVMFEVPEGYTEVYLEVACNLHVGAFTASTASGRVVDAVCTGWTFAWSSGSIEPGNYYGVASFTGLNGVTVRVTGVPA